MKTSLFGHELREALREARWFIPIPSLVTLLALALWHFVWVTHSAAPMSSGILTMSQREGQELINSVWPYVAWLVPYAILKFPDLKERDAFWRTTPMPASHVFGSRMLVAFVATVPLPALVCAAFAGFVLPEIAVSQTGVVVLNQAIYFAFGVFAALSAPRHRGVLTLGLMAVVWCVTRQVTTDLLAVVKSGAWSGYDFESPALRYGIPVVVIPSAVLLIRFTNKNLRVKTYAGIAAGLSAGVVFAEAFAPAKTAEAVATLPEVSVAMSSVPPEVLRSEAEKRRQAEGYWRTDTSVVLGEGRVPMMPTGFIPDIWSGSEGQPISGSWTDGTRHEMFDGERWAEPKQTGLSVMVPRWGIENGVTVMENYMGQASKDDDRLRAALHDLISDPALQVWSTIRGQSKRYEWKRADSLGEHDPLVFRFASPAASSFSGKNLTMTGLVPGITLGEPSVLYRGPAGKPGAYRSTTLAMAWNGSESRGSMSPNRAIGMDAKMAQRRAPFRALFATPEKSPEFSENLHAILYHPKLHQVVFLGVRLTRTESNSPLSTDEMNGKVPYVGAEFFDGYILTNAGPFPKKPGVDYSTLSVQQESWIKEAELLIFTYKNDRQVTLPVRATLTVPTAR